MRQLIKRHSYDYIHPNNMNIKASHHLKAGVQMFSVPNTLTVDNRLQPFCRRAFPTQHQYDSLKSNVEALTSRDLRLREKVKTSYRIGPRSSGLVIWTNFSVKIAVSGRPFSNMNFDWLAVVFPANMSLNQNDGDLANKELEIIFKWNHINSDRFLSKVILWDIISYKEYHW